jgi:MFS family permease
MGFYESAVGVATIVGPLLGGVLIDYWDWPSVFVVLGLVAGLGGWLSITSIPVQDTSVQLPTFDWRGALSLTAAILLLLVGVTRRLPVALVAGGLIFMMWLRLARRASQPFADPTIFGNSRFVSAALAAMLRMLLGIAVLTALPLFLEDVQHYSTPQVGLILPIYSLFLFLGSQPGGLWSDHAGARSPSVAGFAMMTVGVAILIFVSTDIALVVIAIAMAARGIGAGISQAPFAQAATNVVKPDQRASAAGLYSMVRYSGLALGSALVGVLLETRFEFYGSDGSGASAIPAFRELFVVLTVLGLIGLALSWHIGAARPREDRNPMSTGQAAHE